MPRSSADIICHRRIRPLYSEPIDVQQIKIFKGLENDVASIEKEVNAWLKSGGAKVINIFGNIAPQTPKGDPGHPVLGAERQAGKTFHASDVLIVVVYEGK